MNFNVGTKVRVDRCEVCPAVVGKIAKITALVEDGEKVMLSYGRGRPQRNRPIGISVDDISLVEEVSV